MTNILLHGGGIDSTAILALSSPTSQRFFDDYPEYRQLALGISRILYVDYGHLAAREEVKAIKRQIDFTNLGLPLIESFTTLDTAGGQLFTGNLDDDPEIVGRNDMLLTEVRKYRSKASLLRLTVIMGLEPAVNPMDDCTEKFVETWVKKNVKWYPYLFNIEAPFLRWTVADYAKLIVALFKHESTSMIMNMCMTCWIPSSEDFDPHCGKCKHCLKLADIQTLVHTKQESNNHVSSR